MADKGVSIVTGASSGIGRALALELASNGHDLIVTSNEPERLAALKAEIGSQASVEIIDADLREREGVETLYKAVRTGDRPIEILVANAGIGIRGAFTQTSLEEELDIIRLNVTSQVHLVKLIAPRMVEQGTGRILITSSQIALTPAPFMAIYGASKAFLHSFGQSIRNELKDTGVSVTVLMPAATDTDFWKRADMTNARVANGKLDDPADVARKAYKALMKGESEIVPGLANKLISAAAQLVPEEMVADNLRDAPYPKGEHAPDQSRLQGKGA